MSKLEKLKFVFGAATPGKWDALGRFHSIGFGISESEDAIGQVFGIGPKADANVHFICQAQNIMPEILADLERLQFLESELAIKIETALESSIEAMSLMREQIEQMRGMFDDEDGSIQLACDKHDDTQKLVVTCVLYLIRIGLS